MSDLKRPELGATPKRSGGVQFCVWAPKAKTVNLILNEQGQEKTLPMKGDEFG